MGLLLWGTYNGKNKMYIAEVLGTPLSEIPPYEFTKKSFNEKYFQEYKELSKNFLLVTAHAPYYSCVSSNEKSLEKARKGLLEAIKKAEIAGAKIFNLHLGGKLDDYDKTIEMASETIKYLLDNTKDIIISLETTYSKYFLGSINEIKDIIETINSERLIISLQLENDWMREKEVYKYGNFHRASEETDTSFWINLLKRALEISPNYLSLRFSQITGIKIRKLVLKKRTVLGMGYPDLEVLTTALAYFIVNDIYYKKRDTEIHLIYTGPIDKKYEDCLKLYSSVAGKIAKLLEK